MKFNIGDIVSHSAYKNKKYKVISMKEYLKFYPMPKYVENIYNVTFLQSLTNPKDMGYTSNQRWWVL